VKKVILRVLVSPAAVSFGGIFRGVLCSSWHGALIVAKQDVEKDEDKAWRFPMKREEGMVEVDSKGWRASHFDEHKPLLKP
jgi:hypothetical protein